MRSIDTAVMRTIEWFGGRNIVVTRRRRKVEGFIAAYVGGGNYL